MPTISTHSRSAVMQIEASMQFKKVKPFAAFCNGQSLIVEQVNIISIADNLENAVTFKYTLADKNAVFAGDGVYSLDESNYSTWDASKDGAYSIVCQAIGLELV